MSKRLFIATQIFLEPQFTDIYKQIREMLKHDKISWQNLQNTHITYKFLGDVQESKIPEILAQMELAVENILEFRIEINRVGIFGSRYEPKVIWMGVQENEMLMQLAKSIRLSMHRIGFEMTRENFVPHFTIGRIAKIHDKKLLESTINKYQNIHIQSNIISKISLYESILHKTGAEHIEIGNVKLK